MKLSRLGLEVIKFFEGFESCPYLCSAGVNTIGYGTTVYPTGIPVSPDDDCITEQEATRLLEIQVNEDYGYCVDQSIQVPVSQCQFDAMVSLCYNIGCSAFSSSTLVQKMNDGDYQGAYDSFDSWVYVNGEVSTGLQNRRDLEQSLFALC